MNTNCIAHYLPKLETGSVAMMMSDIAELIPEFRHVCVCSIESVDDIDPDLDMYLKSKGITTEYTASELPPPDTAVMLFYSRLAGDTVNIDVTRSHTERHRVTLKNAPIFEKYAKARNSPRGNLKLHIGLLFGDNSMVRQFLYDMARNQPENSILFVTTKEHRTLPEIYDKLFKEEKAFACPFNAGVVPKYLEWLDIAAMTSISDRLKLEIEAAGIPVITGDTDKIIAQITDIRNNRELYKQTRRHALLNAAGNDMAYEIIKLKTQIGRSISCNISNSQSEREFLATLTQAAEYTLKVSPSL